MRDKTLKNKRKIKIIAIGITLILVGSIITIFLLNPPILHVQNFLEGNKDKNTSSVGIEYPNGKPYNYWFAPDNSFGISEMKTINWSYFKQLFNQYCDWELEYKRYSYSEWTNGNEYMTIEKTWNESGFWKFNLIFDVPVHIYSARFTFACDMVVLNYVEREGYEVWLNYSANETEKYSMLFNWSDIASIPNLIITKGIYNNRFWFRFRRDNIPAGHYEFDPTFGYSNTGAYSNLHYNAYERMAGMYSSPASDGTADSITIRTYSTWTDVTVQCALYNYVSATDIGTQIALTESRSGLSASTLETFTFSDPKPTITSGTNYYLLAAVPSDDNYGTSRISAKSQSGTPSRYKSSTSGVPWTDPYTGEGGQANIPYIYCTYSEGGENTAPTLTGEAPVNASTDIVNGCVDLYVICTDDDGDTMNATWGSNSSGSWVEFAYNNTITSGTNITQQNCNFTECGTTYWWNVTLWDDNGSAQFTEWYIFTTEACYDDDPPVLGNETPTNASTNIAISTSQLTIDIYDDNATFDWTIQVNDGATTAGSDDNGQKTLTFDNNLNYSTEYKWWVNTTDSNATIQSAWYSFTTVAYGDSPPTVSDENPNNGSTNIPITNNSISIDVTDENASFDWEIEVDDGATESGSDTNGIKTLTFASNLNYSTVYNWWFNVTDSNSTAYSWSFSFTTRVYEDSMPVLGNETPTNGSTGIAVTTSQFTIDIYDENASFDYSLECNDSATTYGSNGNGEKSLSWDNDLNYSTEYKIWCNVTDSNSTVYYYWYKFTTGAVPVSPTHNITISGIYPSNNSEDIPLQPVLFVTIEHTTGKTMNISWYYSTDNITFTLFTTEYNVNNGTYNTLYYPATNKSESYYWKVFVEDNISSESAIYEFITEGRNIVVRNNLIYGVLGILALIGLGGYVYYQKKKNDF